MPNCTRPRPGVGFRRPPFLAPTSPDWRFVHEGGHRKSRGTRSRFFPPRKTRQSNPTRNTAPKSERVSRAVCGSRPTSFATFLRALPFVQGVSVAEHPQGLMSIARISPAFSFRRPQFSVFTMESSCISLELSAPPGRPFHPFLFLSPYFFQVNFSTFFSEGLGRPPRAAIALDLVQLSSRSGKLVGALGALLLGLLLWRPAISVGSVLVSWSENVLFHHFFLEVGFSARSPIALVAVAVSPRLLSVCPSEKVNTRVMRQLRLQVFTLAPCPG